MTRTLHRWSGFAVMGLPLVALLTVLTGFGQPPQADEGTGAHIFQLAVALMLPAGLCFVASADEDERRHLVRRLALPAAVLVAAFVALYFLEHGR